MLRENIESHLPQLMAYAMVLSRDRNDAQDLVHDCVVKALSTVRRPLCEASLRPWLFSILHNTFVDSTRRPCNREVVQSDLPEAEDWQVWRHEASLINALTVRSGLKQLSAEHRQIIALVDIAGFRYKEAAEILGIRSGTVMSRLSRARRALLGVIMADNLYVLPATKVQGL